MITWGEEPEVVLDPKQKFMKEIQRDKENTNIWREKKGAKKGKKKKPKKGLKNTQNALS